jgi:small subunit ribosomal protein S21
MMMTKDKDISIYITIDEKMGVERSLKKFKRLCESFGVIREYRKRQEYKKPSVRIKEKSAAAEKRRKKTAMKYSKGSRF